MQATTLVWAMLAMSIYLGLAPAEAVSVGPATVETGDGERADDSCVMVDPYTGEVVINPDCVSP